LVFCNSKSFFTAALAILLLVIVICQGCSPKDKAVESSSVEGIEEIDLLSLVSVQISGWEEKDAALMSKTKAMSKYMGNEAKLYMAYKLKRLATKKYRSENSLPMLVEVYEFDSSENAYGMYSFDTVGDKQDIGQGAVYGHGLLRFWKDKLLVRVVAAEEYAKLEKDVLLFGRQVDSKILTTGSMPHLLSLLPKERIIQNSLHFFHTNICLNNIFYIPESTTLGLSEQTDALMARYDLGSKQPPLLLLIDYPNVTAATTAFTEFGALYFQGESLHPERRINIMKMGVEQYASITLVENFVMLVFDAQNPDVCKKLVAATLANIELHSKSIDP